MLFILFRQHFKIGKKPMKSAKKISKKPKEEKATTSKASTHKKFVKSESWKSEEIEVLHKLYVSLIILF